MFHECENDQLMDRFNSWLLLDYHHIHAHTDMYDTQNSLNINNPLRPGSSAERYSALFSWFLRQLRARSPQSESATPWGDSHNCQRVKNRRSRIRRRKWTSDLLHRTQRKGGENYLLAPSVTGFSERSTRRRHWRHRHFHSLVIH